MIACECFERRVSASTRCRPLGCRYLFVVGLLAVCLAALPAARADEPEDPPSSTLPAPDDEDPVPRGETGVAEGNPTPDVDPDEKPGERDADGPPQTPLEILSDTLTGGDLHLSLRLRAELVDQSLLRYAEAYTARLRLGYGTKPWHGLSAYAELEDVRAADDDLYNAAGLNGEPTRAVVADVPDTELNQLFLRYDWKATGSDFRAGRQRITLDDHRFVGNVGWRQNEQTFDAVSAASSLGVEGLSLYWAYLWEINRIFGPDADRDFESNSHLIRASIDIPGLPEGSSIEPAVFGYLLDFRDDAPALSSNTVGLRVTAKHEVDDDFEIAFYGSFAHQADAGMNPVDYDAPYWSVEPHVIVRGVDLGAGYEVLGDGEGTAAFSTPLATLHKFNGWADVFLATPANGLEDAWLTLGAKLPFGVKGAVDAHIFFEDAGGSRLGAELDALLARPITDEITALVKYANFQGHDGFPDVQKIWFQLELEF